METDPHERLPGGLWRAKGTERRATGRQIKAAKFRQQEPGELGKVVCRAVCCIQLALVDVKLVDVKLVDVKPRFGRNGQEEAI